MAIYGVTIKGRSKRVLIRESSAAKAVAHLVEAKALSGEEMQDAIEAGEGVWKPGDDLPADDLPPAKGEAELQALADAGARKPKADEPKTD